jgi:hypothetical protein
MIIIFIASLASLGEAFLVNMKNFVQIINVSFSFFEIFNLNHYRIIVAFLSHIYYIEKLFF